MLYYLYEYLTANGVYIPGLNLFRYISFRAGMAVLMSLFIGLVYGKNILSSGTTKIIVIAMPMMTPSLRKVLR